MSTHSKASFYVQPWHFDCRLSKELPDNNPIRGRFLANLLASGLMLIALMGMGYAIYSYKILQDETRDWQLRLSSNRAETIALEGVTKAITQSAKRIDDAYGLVSNPLVLSDFIQEIGLTRPPGVRLEMIESNTGVIFIRGGLRESSQRASALLGRYVADLRADTQIAPLFASITLSSWERNAAGDTINFEITLKLKPDTP